MELLFAFSHANDTCLHAIFRKIMRLPLYGFYTPKIYLLH